MSDTTTGAVYATVSDITAIGRTLTAQQSDAASVLLTQASAKLRLTARQYGKDIDAMIADADTGADFALAVKSVVVQAVCRALDAVDSSGTVSQASETLGAYTYSYSYANAGQNLYFLNNELRDLGLRRQRFGVLEVFSGEC
jgi:hypothetical protein